MDALNVNSKENAETEQEKLKGILTDSDNYHAECNDHKNGVFKTEDFINYGGNSKKRWMKTIAIDCFFLILGMATAAPGPTIVNLKQLYNTQTTTISIIFSMSGLGYMLAAIACGCIFDKFNQEFQFICCCFISGIFYILAPWSPHIYLLFASMLLFGMGVGYADTAGNTQVILLWQGNKLKDPHLQFLHCIWSVGGLIAPFIVTPFLVEMTQSVNQLPQNISANTSILGNTLQSSLFKYSLGDSPEDSQQLHDEINSSKSYNMNISQEFHLDDTLSNINDVSIVRFAYLCIGILLLLMGMFYIWLLLIQKPLSIRYRKSKERKQNKDVKKNYESYIVYGILIFISLCYSITLNIAGSYYSIFVIEQLNWGVRQGALLTSVFFGTAGLGRFMGIPISYKFKASKLIVINVSLNLIGQLIFLMHSRIPDFCIFVGVTFSGLGLSTLLTNTLLWVSNYIPVSSGLSASCFTGVSIGLVTGYYAIGWLMQEISYNCFTYVLTAASVFQIAGFVSLKLIHSSFNKPLDRNTKSKIANL